MKRSKFSLSHYKLLSCDMGELIPCGLMEVLPGDTIQHATSILARTQPLFAPIMHPVSVRVHHWYVPHRLVWDSWEKFITGGPDGLDASVFPTITHGGGTGAAVGSLADYLGVVPLVNNLVTSALPFRGYALIWNEWYRDQDLQTALTISTADGADSTTSTALQSCDWEKDYFTSARPWEQKGPSITIPIGSTAPVKGLGVVGTTVNSAQSGSTFRESGTLPNRTYTFANAVFGNNGLQVEMDSTGSGTAKPNVFADLSGASAVTISALRQALSLQRFEEARARYGSRYTEYLRYLGVTSSDARLQRPEYLGGGKNTLQFSEVVATAETGTSVDVGDLRGHGIGAVRSNRYRRFFEEHGYVYSFVSVRPKTMYVQGLARTWNRRAKEDFWQKELEHIGQQAIKNKEVYAAHATPDGTFGYQDRYDEYRRTESSIAGEFRTTNLDYWHMARVFASTPALNSTFVSSVPTKRNFPVTTFDVMQLMCNHSIQARRIIAPLGTSFTL